MKFRNEKFKNLIFYEIYPTSFYDSNNDGIGDLKGIELKLDYIKDLGFNAIWLNPFFKSPFRDGGYDVEDFFDVDPKFGTIEDFKSLIDKANKLNIKIIIDCVAGHTSEENKEFLASGKGIKNEYSDMFIWTESVWNNDPRYKLIAGRHDRDGNYLVNFFSFQPALNFGFNKIIDPKWQMSYQDERTYLAREFIVKFCKFWLNLGVFGFRVDMADSLVKEDEDKTATIEVWKYIFNKIKKDYPDSFFVSEWSNPDQAFQAGFDCDFVLDHWHNFYHKLARSNETTRGISILNGGDMGNFMEDLAFRYKASIEKGGYLGNISGNHDTWRIASYLDHKRLKLFYLFMFSMPGIPFMYYGDEIEMSFKNIPTKDGGYQRTGSRTPMQWDHSRNDGFSKSNEIYLPVNTANDISVEDNQKNNDSIYYLIKKLIELRISSEDLMSKEMNVHEYNKIITISRNNLTLVMNCGNSPISLDGEIIFTLGKENTLQPFEGALIK